MVSCMPLLIKGPENHNLSEMRLIGQLTFVFRIMGSLTCQSGENQSNIPMIVCRHCNALELEYLGLLFIEKHGMAYLLL